jgi:hypothetical protein
MQNLQTVLAFWFNAMAVLLSPGIYTGTAVNSHTLTSALHILFFRLKPNITVFEKVVSGKSTD